VSKIILTGRLGRDPELRFTKAGKAVSNLSLAVKQRVKRGNGYEDTVAWHRIVCWQGLAEDAQALHKGSAIRVEGFQKSRTFEARDGETRTIVEIVADKIDALDSAEQPASAPATPSRNASGAQSRASAAPHASGVPFVAPRRSEGVPKPYSQPAANGNRPTNGGVPRAQIPGSEWDSV
jgi:single-strand DNA-binding protein